VVFLGGKYFYGVIFYLFKKKKVIVTRKHFAPILKYFKEKHFMFSPLVVQRYTIFTVCIDFNKKYCLKNYLMLDLYVNQ
jgi:hypothetical protein